MKICIYLLLPFAFITNIQAQPFIKLWPEGQLPNSKGMSLEHKEERQRITQVAEPGMYAFFTSKEENSGSAVLICPPGGYAKLTYNLAGFQFAKWLNTCGINAFVLIHRLPTSPDLKEREKGPIQDAQRAMKIIRANATSWKLDTAKIGVMGASAGGHVATTLGTHMEDYSAINDSLDTYPFIPNFMILISPVITMGDYAHKGSMENLLGKDPLPDLKKTFSNELNVTTTTSPTFIAVAQNDPVVNVMNSILFYQSMIKQAVPGSLHVFPKGAHSIALRNTPDYIDLWSQLCEKWLKDIGINERL